MDEIFPHIDDPFERWITRAIGLAPSLHLPLDFIEEAAAIVRSAFGEEWIRKSLARPTHTPLVRIYRHPVLDAFSAPGPNQCVELLELAVYLKRLIGVKNLEQVIKSMKSQYAPGLLQLAHAYRFLRLGAVNMLLEPSVEGGRLADIAFDLMGRNYLVECYIPRSSHVGQSLDEMQRVAKPVMQAFSKLERKLRLSIRLQRSIGAVERRAVQRLALETVKALGASMSVEQEDANAKILLEDIGAEQADDDFPKKGEGFHLYGGADWGICSSPSTIGSLVETIQTGKEHETLGRGSRLFLWAPPEERREPSSEERVLELVRKIDDKLSQTRDSRRQALRIVIVKAPSEALAKDQEATEICSRIQHEIIPRHDRVAAIFITARAWTPDQRYRYFGKILLGKRGEELVPSLVLALNVDERFKDILTDYN